MSEYISEYENDYEEGKNEKKTLDKEWITQFEKTDKLYQNFYKEDLYYTNVHFIYINQADNIEKIREEVFYMKTPNYISRDEILGILKRNSMHNNKKFSILSILKYVITLEPTEVIEFLKNTTNDVKYNFLTSIKHIDAISFNPSISMFQDLTDLFFVFHEKQIYNPINSKNFTKKIYLHKQTNHKKTIKKY